MSKNSWSSRNATNWPVARNIHSFPISIWLSNYRHTMDIYHSQRSERYSSSLVELPSDQFDNVIDLRIQHFKVFLWYGKNSCKLFCWSRHSNSNCKNFKTAIHIKSMRIDSFLDFSGPVGLRHAQNDLTSPIQYPSFARSVSVSIEGLETYTLYVLQHGRFNFKKPFFNHTLIKKYTGDRTAVKILLQEETNLCFSRIYRFGERNYFIFRTDHPRNLHLFCKAKFGDTLEAFLQMRLYTKRVLRLG